MNNTFGLRKTLKTDILSKAVLSIVFGILNCLGYAYSKYFTMGMWVINKKAFIMFVFFVSITSLTFYFFCTAAFAMFDKSRNLSNTEDVFWSHNVGWKCMGVIMTFRIPYFIISFPGATSVDSSYQLRQVFGNTPYSTQQPLFSTILLGLFVKAGGLLGNYDLGLFSYILFQSLVMAAAFSYSLKVLHSFEVHVYVKYFILAVYAFLPMYGNFATMAVKDTLYASFSVFYVVTLSQMLAFYKRGESYDYAKYIPLYILSASMITLFRSEGIYIVSVTALFLIFYYMRGQLLRKDKIICCITFALPIIIWIGTMWVINVSLHPVKDTAREKLSVPFQQTARYLRDHPDDLSDEDRDAIESVINYKWYEIGEKYDPVLADPIKNNYVRDADVNDLVNYFKAWGRGLFKHPASYIDTYLNHIFGWYYVGTDNDIRYEGKYGIFSDSLWGDRDVKYWIELLGDFPIFWVLQSAPINIWMLILLTVYKVIRKDNDGFVGVAVFLYMGLVFCLLAPAFYLHPRYAFLIMFPMFYLVAFYACSKGLLSEEKALEQKHSKEKQR